MVKYQFSKKYDFWEKDHYANFEYIRQYYNGGDYGANRYSSDFHLNFLEIGVFEGRTSVWLLDNILKKEFTGRGLGFLHCIEPRLTENGRHNLVQHIDFLKLYEASSFDILSVLLYKKAVKFDFIYIDGDHNASGLLEDLVLSFKLLKKEGVMLIDDYEMKTTDPWLYESHPEFNENNPRLRFTHPRIAIDAFLNIYRGQYDLIIDNYQIGIKKKIELS